MNNIFEKYNKSHYLEKSIYFSTLSDQDKVEVFKLLPPNQKKELINYLTISEIIHLHTLLDDELKNELYKNLNNKQLSSYYYSLTNKEEKELFLNKIDDLKLNLRDNIEQNNDSIIENSINITNSENLIKENIDTIRIKKQELKDIKKIIKKISNEQKHQLKKLLQSSKPSVLDKIGFISKKKMEVLQNKIRKYNEITSYLKNEENIKKELEIEIDNASNIISHEKENINKYKEEIKETIITINNNKVTIKNISLLERKVLGNALYKKMCQRKDIVCTLSKNKKEDNTKDIVNNVIEAMDNLNELGIEFHQNEIPFAPQKNEQLLDTVFGKISPSQIIILGQAITDYGNHLNEQKEIENAKTKIKTAGYINYSLIIFFITIIMIVSVFIGTKILK